MSISCLPLRTHVGKLRRPHNLFVNSTNTSQDGKILGFRCRNRCDDFSLSLNMLVANQVFVGFYSTLQTTLQFEWKLWVSGAELGGQHLAGYFSSGSLQAEVDHKHDGWFPVRFHQGSIQKTPYLQVQFLTLSSMLLNDGLALGPVHVFLFRTSNSSSVPQFILCV